MRLGFSHLEGYEINGDKLTEDKLFICEERLE